MITFQVPSGIGDVSWLYSKLKHIEPAQWLVAEGWPPRTAPFLKLLPNVVDAGYGPFNYEQIIRFEEYHELGSTPTWQAVKGKGFSSYFIECNRHLEMGKRLEEWLPDLETDFHYSFNLPAEDKARAARLLMSFERPLWGISAASYRGAEAWKTWGFDEWKEFLSKWHELAGGTIVLMGGFWDDLTATLASEEGYKDIVGKTSVAGMLHVLDLLDGYIGFSSGMGIIRTVLNKPVFMMWPDHQVELSTSWAPMHMLEEGSYVASQWKEPRLVFERAKSWHKESYSNGKYESGLISGFVREL